jgi:hypothetical protein
VAGSAPNLEPRRIFNSEYVSQYGSRLTGSAVFHDRPRTKDREALSVIAGQIPVDEARVRVRGLKAGPPTSTDGVRYALVGDLRAQDFVVTHDPRPGNMKHVRIGYKGTWDDRVASNLDRCFSEPTWHDEREGGQGEGSST